MKKGFIFIGLLIIIMTLAGCTGSRSRVGIMDMEQVLDESQRAGQLKQELSQIGQKLEEDYNAREEELSEDREDEELDAVYGEYVDNKQRLENKLNQEINKVLADIAEEDNLEIVLYKKNVHFGGKDVTEKVIEELDESFYKGGGKSEETE